MALTIEEKRQRRNEYMREYGRKFREKYGVSINTKWRRENPDAAEIHRDTEKQRWYSDPTIKKRHAAVTKAFTKRLRIETFQAYGGEICACCGELEVKFLTIDHINNDGWMHRKTLGDKGNGSNFKRWLKAQGFPPGYQILCMNCNFGKRMNGGICPHKAA